MVLYISKINDELSLQESKTCFEFEYNYSWSFYLIGASFVMEEMSAVISIKLFLLQSSCRLTHLLNIIPGLEDKIYVNMDTEQCLFKEHNTHTLIW